MSVPKPFQKATVQAAIRTLNKSKSKRFLVADEVGLGKTVVAQQIILEMMEHKQGPLVVFYVCSNLSIANQNRAKLLEIMETEDEKSSAHCNIDRLTLLPSGVKPTHPRLHLYTLTPDTSLPLRAGMRRDGKAEERALLHNLVAILYPQFLLKRGEKFFQRGATRYWDWYKDQQHLKAMNQDLQRLFDRSVRKEFGIKPRFQVHTQLLQIKDDLMIIAHMRNALAAIAVEENKPDLVIFDEFQRFRDVITSRIEETTMVGASSVVEVEELNVEYAANRVLKGLRGDNMKSPPALLLLSATPYRLYSTRWEDEITRQPYEEFFELVEFLYGGGRNGQKKRKECEDAFRELHSELRRGSLDSLRTHQVKQKIEGLLRKVMARTERFAWLEKNSHSSGKDKLEILATDLQEQDVLIYKHLSDSLDPMHKSSAVPFWMSIPMPMQFMSSDYISWKNARTVSPNGAFGLNQEMRNDLEAPDIWPHPRLRKILNEEISRLALPWIAPSLPWWNLGGGWQKNASKVLLFSRFQAVPGAIAGLVSYHLESALLSQQTINYSEITKRKRLQARATQQNLLAIFTPWPWIVTHTEPLAAKTRTWGATTRAVKEQILEALQTLNIEVVNSGVTTRPLWQLLVQIEKKAEQFGWVLECWRRLYHNIQKNRPGEGTAEAGLIRLLNEWEQVSIEDFSPVTQKELNELTRLALQGIGNVVGRALQRHWESACVQAGYYDVIDVAWNGLRTYLDQRWFVKALEGERNYPAAIQRAVKEGNLESVLDEHLWITRQLRGLKGQALAHDLRNAIRLRSSTVTLHSLGDKQGQGFTLRCHVAIPYTKKQMQFRVSDTNEIKPLRADELRSAFNTPFWPFLLTTTSIGQEGLDFHVWCDTLVHWDLCNNPVDLEQREGRIQRYGGLSIRRAIADRFSRKAFKETEFGASPWDSLAQFAEKARPRDPSGLSPWWIFQGAQIHRYVFDVPLSAQEQRLSWLQKQRMLYRLVLGQPNQEDLVEYLANFENIDFDFIEQYILNLSPYYEKHRKSHE